MQLHLMNNKEEYLKRLRKLQEVERKELLSPERVRDEKLAS